MNVPIPILRTDERALDNLRAPKTFFFATYEGLRGKSSKPMLSLVPDATLRTGDFRGRNPIFNPFDIDPASFIR